jgi:hypothetical protein
MNNFLEVNKDHCNIIKNIDEKIAALSKAQHCISSLKTISPNCIEDIYRSMLSELILDLYDHRDQHLL